MTMGQTGIEFSRMPNSLQLIGETNLKAHFSPRETISMMKEMLINPNNEEKVNEYLNIKEDGLRSVQTMNTLFGSFFEKEKITEKELKIMKSLYGLEQETLIMDAGIDEPNITDMKERSINSRILYSAMTNSFIEAINSYNILQERKNEAIIRWNKTFGHVYKGQLLDYINAKNKNITLDQYIEMITECTARFIQLSSYLGASLSNQKESTIKNVDKYGKNLGIAFQIRDDFNDLKKDLSEGKYRIFLSNEALNLLNDSTKNIISKEYPNNPDLAYKIITKSPIIAFVKGKNNQFIDSAINNLEGEKGMYKERLIDFAETMRI